MQGDSEARLECLLNNNKNSDFCAPLTAFDWNEIDPNILGIILMTIAITNKPIIFIAIFNDYNGKVQKQIFVVAWKRQKTMLVILCDATH